MVSVVEEINKPNSKVFRRAYIRRRLQGSGLFEDDFTEISADVKKWGKVEISTTPERPGTFRFSTIKLRVANDQGKYNPEDDPSSLWFGFMNMQRTIVKIEYGFLNQTKTNGIWNTIVSPGQLVWDKESWDNTLNWDGGEERTTFHGIISGDPKVSDNNEIILTIKPLAQTFKDFPASLLDGYTSTGLTATQFLESVRDFQDSGSNYVFRPFFGDTTANWDIAATTINYGGLNTTTANDVVDKTVWNIMEKLGQAENMVPFVDLNGVFRFKTASSVASTAAFIFGKGTFDPANANTIKRIERFGPRLEAYYSRVQIKFDAAATSTSYVSQESALSISSANNAWTFGYRTFSMENYFIPDLSIAASIATTLFNDLSSLKDEITFRTSFIPHIKILDRVEVTYDSGQPEPISNWNENDWNTELQWADSAGDAINLVDTPFTITKVSVNLDNYESMFTGRAI